MDVQVIGLKEFSAELKKVGPEWPKQLTKVHRTVAVPLAAAARSNAQAMGGVQAKAAKTIRAKATQRSVGVGPGAVGSNPYANVAFWGRRTRSGWYAQAKYAGGGKPQGLPWVGANWEAGRRGEGPYAINDAVADAAGLYEKQLLDAYSDLVKRAFPD